MIEHGLECSRVLVLCMSANAFDSEWAQLQSQTLRFRDPLNFGRRFVLVRLDETKPKDSLAQVLYIDLRLAHLNEGYTRLRDACQPRNDVSTTTTEVKIADKSIELREGPISSYAFNPDGRHVLTGTPQGLTLWDLDSGQSLRLFSSQKDDSWLLAWSRTEPLALSGSWNATLRLWDIPKRRCLCKVQCRLQLWGIALNCKNQKCVIANVGGLSLWDLREERPVAVFQGPVSGVRSVAWSDNEEVVISGHANGKIQVWDVALRRSLVRLEGHTGQVWAVALAADGSLAISGSTDTTIRVWNTSNGKCLRVLEGHTDRVDSIACTRDGRYALSGSHDRTLRLWRLDTGQCLCVLRGHSTSINTIAWSRDELQAFSGDRAGGVRIWDLSKWLVKRRSDDYIETRTAVIANHVQYTNAKVLLVGESGAGKLGFQRFSWVRNGSPATRQ